MKKLFKIRTFLIFIAISLTFFIIGEKKGKKITCKIRKKVDKNYSCTKKPIHIAVKKKHLLDKTIELNSFEAIIKPFSTPNYKVRTAYFYERINNNKSKPTFIIYTQNGTIVNTETNIFTSVKLPQDKEIPEVKSVFKFQGKMLGLLGRIKVNCIFASIIDFQTSNILFSTPCLPDPEASSFNGIGGGHAILNDSLLLSIGVPESSSPEIRRLGLNMGSPYGKIHEFKFNENKTKLISKIFSYGHRNPQSITIVDGRIYSVEHGPRGGDELNLIEKGNDYGWPKASFGARYDGARFGLGSNQKGLTDPLYAFLPSIGISGVYGCPLKLKKFYDPYICLLISSLRGNSIYITLLDKKAKRVISIEQVLVQARIREFLANPNMKGTKVSDDTVYFSSDVHGIGSLKFTNFR